MRYFIVYFDANQRGEIKTVGNVDIKTEGFFTNKEIELLVTKKYPAITSVAVIGFNEISEADYEYWRSNAS